MSDTNLSLALSLPYRPILLGNKEDAPKAAPDQRLLTGLQEITALKLDTSKGHYVSLQTQRDQNGKILSFTVAHESYNKSGVLCKITNFFKALLKSIGVFKRIFPSHIDDLKELSEVYEAVLEQIRSCPTMDPMEQAKWKSTVENSFAKLKKLYEINRDVGSLEAIAYKMDVLEAVAVAVKEDGVNDFLGTQITRIKADTLEKQAKKLPRQAGSHLTPIIRMEHVDVVSKLIEEAFPHSTPTLQQLLDHKEIRKYLIIEKVAAGRVVSKLYKNQKSRLGRMVHNASSFVITHLMGRWARKELAPGTARTTKILRFFKGSDISVWTPITSSNGTKELHAYSEIFQKKLREETSIDEAFQRGMNDASLDLFLKEADQAIENGEQPIISNAFCRIRVLPLGIGAVCKRFTIEGKLLGTGDPKKGFSVKNMLGFEDTVPTASPEQAIAPSNPNDADELYRASLVNAANKLPATVVVQRLAPTDVHRFVQPVKGRILSTAESCKKLKEMLQNTNTPEEIAQLEELIKYYEDQEEQRTSVRIQGTRQSVSTLATKHSNPLSQNDRKVQVILHDNGQISLHIYIGALGVNSVNLPDKVQERDIGTDIGSMGFGNDEMENREHWPKMATEENSVMLRESAAKPGKIGEESGRFHRNGSTVVSIYFNLEPSETMKQAQTIRYKEKEEIRQVEVLAEVGHVIGYERY